MCIMLIVALKCRCWTLFTGFARKFLNRSLSVTAFSTVAMTMQKSQMCQSFLCHRLSEPRFVPSQRTERSAPEAVAGTTSSSRIILIVSCKSWQTVAWWLTVKISCPFTSGCRVLHFRTWYWNRRSSSEIWQSSLSRSLMKTCVSQVLSWRHWAKFCVNHGGFGAMAPALYCFFTLKLCLCCKKSTLSFYEFDDYTYKRRTNSFRNCTLRVKWHSKTPVMIRVMSLNHSAKQERGNDCFIGRTGNSPP